MQTIKATVLDSSVIAPTQLHQPFSKANRALFAVFTILAIFWIVFFAQWWFRPYHLPDSLHGSAGRVEDIGLFILVAYVVWHPILMQIFSWAITFQIKDPLHLPAAPGLRVAMITTFVPQSESVDLLRRCLPAMVGAQYPHDTWLLDEGNVPEVKDLCSKLGVKHYTRAGQEKYNTDAGKFCRRTKGGNHNSWYDQHGRDYDIVAQMDTDFIPNEQFLVRTLGHFRDPKVAFVGTPQIYGNTTESLVADGAAQQAYKFYGPILRGFSGMGTMLMIGANHVVRVTALEDVDLYSAHITEDLITGMKLHAKGWTSVYVPEPLAIGEGPATWTSFFNQQMRWAYGCFDILFRYSPRLLHRMGAKRAWFYFFTQQYYFSGLTMAIGLLGLGLYAAFGITSTRMNIDIFLAYYVPTLAICEFMELWLQRFNIRPNKERGLLFAGRLTSLATWPIFFLALVGVISGKRLVYKVTPKGTETEKSSTLHLGIFAAHFLISIYCVMCFIFAIRSHHQSPIMLSWLAFSAVTMLFLPFSAAIWSFLKGNRGPTTN